MTLPFLPILTFDERRLSPSFGYLFDRRWLDPHESIVSILWKFVQANAVAGHVVASELARVAIDPYAGVDACRDRLDMVRLKSVLGLPRKILLEALIPAQRHRAVSPFLRYCSRCLGRGYHSVVHQFECVRSCPIHDQSLATSCPDCGYQAPYRLTARLLETPYRCADCRSRYGTRWPNVARHLPMPMEDVIPITALRIGRCRF